MSTMYNFLVAIFMLSLFGCANTYYHPTKSTQEFNSDKAQCMALSNSGGSNQIMPSFGSSFAQGYNQGAAIAAAGNSKEIFNSCMLGKGWSKEKPGQNPSYQQDSSKKFMQCWYDKDCPVFQKCLSKSGGRTECGFGE